jgi:hypothetical protein
MTTRDVRGFGRTAQVEMAPSAAIGRERGGSCWRLGDQHLASARGRGDSGGDVLDVAETRELEGSVRISIWRTATRAPAAGQEDHR